MQFVLYKDVAGYFRWTLYASNNLKVADSAEGYTTKANALHGINLVKSTTAYTPVSDRT
jgi:uncharacterized protein YegP (UPF0339 family)